MSAHSDLVRGLYGRMFFDAPFEAVAPALHDDVVIDWSRSLGPYRGVYRGMEEARRARAAFGAAWQSWTNTLEEVTELRPGLVLTVASAEAEGCGSGVSVRTRGAMLWWLEDGRVRRVALFQSREDALAGAAP